MVYTELSKKAMKIAYQAHKNQLDKGGIPYIFHPLHLAEQMDTEYLSLIHIFPDKNKSMFRFRLIFQKRKKTVSAYFAHSKTEESKRRN